jgi:hypothetical protein
VRCCPPAPRAREQRGGDGLRRGPGRGLVGDDVAHEVGDRHVGVLLHADVAGEALDDRVVDAPVAIRARVAVAADRDGDQLRIALAQLRLAEAEALGRAGPPVLHEHVGAIHEREQGLAAARLLEVEHDAALAAVRVHVEARAPAAPVGADPHRVADPRRLDLHHLGALIREDHAGEGARQDLRDVDDANACERSRHRSS